MESFVFVAVLFAAGCHAGWNAIIKVRLDPLSSTVLIAAGSATVGLICLPIVGMPASPALPWLIASLLFYLLYFAALIESYRTGDLGQVYPIARGAAPLLTATAGAFFIGEHPSLLVWAGIATLAAGVLLLSARGGRDIAHLDYRTVGYALLAAFAVCAFALTDGIGARASKNPQSYAVWLLVGNFITLVSYGLWRNSSALKVAVHRFWLRGLLGGALQALSFGIALWAMTLAPIAIVVSLRETSVLFATAISVVVLKEPFQMARILSSILIVGGLVLIRLGS